MDSWEKDPLFSAAEQVQDSADRLESAYRALNYAKSLSQHAKGSGRIDIYRRELSTAFGIAKWQLEEFEKEVSRLSPEFHVEDNAPQRHQQFIKAITYHLSSVRNGLHSSMDQKDWKILTSVGLQEKESDELAHFLSGSKTSASKPVVDVLSSCSKAEVRENDVVMSASLFSTSSGMYGGKGMPGIFNDCTFGQETCSPSSARDHDLSSQRLILEGSSGSAQSVAPDAKSGDLAMSALLRADCYDDVKREHGHSWTGMNLNGGVACYRDTEESTMLPKVDLRGFLTQTWPSLLRAGPCIGSLVSQSVLKRLKDGEGDPLDLCQMCDDDIEANCSGFLCQWMKGSPEVRTGRSSQKIVLTTLLIQRIIVMLVVLGILCLYLH